MTTLKKLSIYTSEGSRYGSRPLYAAILATALEEGVYSAIALKAMDGFGPQIAVPSTTGMALDSDLPLEVRLIDYDSVIEPFLVNHFEMLSSCLVTLEDVEVVQSPAPPTVSSTATDPEMADSASQDY
ncbi:MAG: DUF190 domain-containing protein [Cyanobacteria bacterium J06636_16]